MAGHPDIQRQNELQGDMASIDPEFPAAQVELQHTVQRKLGRCLLRLQQYELLLKAMVADFEFEGPPDQLLARRDAKAAITHKQTLGTLVGMLTEGYLTSGDISHVADDDEAQAAKAPWFRFRHCISLDAERYESTRAALKELVDLRNELVHHFLQRFNMSEVDACVEAIAYLDTSFETIDGHYQSLRGWAQSMEDTRAMMAAFFASSHFEDLVANGICPDGSVDWPASGAARCLRDAERVFAKDSWTHLNTATAWIRQQHPDQQPQRYGCGSWRQVIHESQQFEIRKTTDADTGRGEVWYRNRQESSSAKLPKRRA